MTLSAPATPTNRLAVDIWLDIACPWCAVGERRFERALAALPFNESIDVRFRSYQLDPGAPERSLVKQPEYWRSKGIDVEQLRNAAEQLNMLGAAVGLEFDQENSIPSNTHTAHRLIQAAAAHGVQTELVDALFSAYFERGEDVGDAAALRALALAAGVPAATADRVLDDPTAFASEVADDIAEAAKLGIQGVPFYVIDGRFGISGAQSEETLGQVLTQVFDELNPAPKFEMIPGIGAVGETCGPDGCTI